MKSAKFGIRETFVARSIAAEDLRRGDFVTVLHEIIEYPSFLWWGDAHMMPPDQPVRMRVHSRREAFPLKVKAICLPFVFVKAPCGNVQVLDVRQCQLVRLDRAYARCVWKELQRARPNNGHQGQKLR